MTVSDPVYGALVVSVASSWVKWCEAPLFGYQKEFVDVGGDPRMEGSSELWGMGANCEVWAKIDDVEWRSYICQQSEV